MATQSREDVYGGMNLVRWKLTDTDGTGLAHANPGSPDRTVHVYGTFNGGTVTLQGSNDPDGLEWATLHDHLGVALTFTAARISTIAENPRRIRAIMTGTVGAALVNVIIGSR